MPKHSSAPPEEPMDLFEREPETEQEEVIPFAGTIHENSDPLEENEMVVERLPEGYVQPHRIAITARTREHIGNLFAENPHLSVYDIGNEFSLWDGRNDFTNESIATMMVERTEESGIADFLRQMKERISEDARAKKNLEAIIERKVEQMLNNMDRCKRTDETKITTIHKVMSILKAVAIPATDKMREKAVQCMTAYIEERPDDAQEFLTCFGIPSADLESSAIASYITLPEIMEKLRSAGIVTIANDDPRMQASALRHVHSEVAYGRGEIDMYRQTYALPEAELHQTIFNALLQKLRFKTRPNVFLEEMKSYNIDMPESFTEKQKKDILECFEYRIRENIDEGIQIRRIFGLTFTDIEAVKKDYAKDMIVNEMKTEKKSIYMDRIAKIQEALDVTDSEVKDMARTLLEIAWGGHTTHGDALAKKLKEVSLADEDVEKNSLRTAIIAAIQGNHSLGNAIAQKKKLCGEGPLFTAEETKEIATKRYLAELAYGDLYDIRQLEEICDPAGLRGCEGEIDAAKKGMRHLLLISCVDIDGARKICERYSLTALDLHESAKAAALVHLGAAWLPQLKFLRETFDLEEFLVSDAAKVAAAESIRHEIVTYLGFARSDYTHDRNRGGRMPMISAKNVDSILQCFAISGVDVAAVNSALRDPQLPHLPAFEEGNFEGLEALKLGCPAIGSVFEAPDVQAHARELILKKLESYDIPLALRYADFSAIPIEEVKNNGVQQSLSFLVDDKVQMAHGIRKQLDIPEVLDENDETLPKPIRTIIRIWKTDTFEKLCTFCEENPKFLQVAMSKNEYSKVQFNNVVITEDELEPIKSIGFSLSDAELMARGLRQNSEYDSVTLGSLITNKNYDVIIDLLALYSHEWRDLHSVLPQFKLGVATFGFKQMCRYANNSKISKHDTLFAFEKILELQALSGLRPSAFYGQIMAQAAKSTALYGGRVGQLHLNDIATTMDRDIPGVLAKAQQFTSIKKLQDAAKKFSSPAAVFASWDNLIRFHQLSRQIERKEGLEKLATYRAQGKHKLCDFAETLAFHEDSDVDVGAVMEFVEKPGEFLGRQDPHAPYELQSSKKPSNYTVIPHLGLTAEDVRDSLPEGNVDALQTIRPLRIDYRIPTNPNQTVSERRTKLRNAIDKAKPASGKAFTKMNRILQQHGTNAKTFLTADDIPEISESVLLDIEDIARKDLSRFYDDKTYVLTAEIHPKSSPEGIIAGDDTDCCMRFGYGKNNVYMFNPGDAIFTVRIEKENESLRTISQSLMTTDMDIGRSVPEVHEALQKNSKLTDILPNTQLKRSTVHLSADNVEVAANYQREPYLTLLENIYRDFFAEYLALYGEEENLSSVIPIGSLHSDALKNLTKIPNTFVPEMPLSYSDKLGATVGDLKPSRVYPEAHKVVTETVRKSVVTKIPEIPGISRLTSRDTLRVAYLEEKIYHDNATLQVHLHNIENGLIAKDIANVRRDNPELSFKYEDQEGTMHGYMIAYQGALESNHLPDDAPDELAGQEAIYISDLAADTKTAGASLIKAFIAQYVSEYLEKGKLLPIYAEAKEKTAYTVIMNLLNRRGRSLGFEFTTEEFATQKSGKDTMHPILIQPRIKKTEDTVQVS